MVLGAVCGTAVPIASEILVAKNRRLRLKQYHMMVMQGPSLNCK